MVVSRGRWVTPGVLLLGAGVVLTGSRATAGDDPPKLEGPLAPPGAVAPDEVREVGEISPQNEPPVHEAFGRPAAALAAPVRVPKPPPPPIAERPRDDAPAPQAQWVAGYWTWDVGRNDFVWVGGAWRVPPPGKIWVDGVWKRDADGWSRAPGFWSDRLARPAARPAGVVGDNPDWRVTGPPADHPADTPSPAPGPDFFYIPGHHAPGPGGASVAWVPGFWAREQPGWDWVPARWVRRPDGWDFRAGYWARDRGAAPARHTVARPPAADTDTDVNPAGLPPAIVESRPVGRAPASDPESPASTDPATTDPDTPLASETDPQTGRAGDPNPVPAPYPPAPPGYVYGYGPGGVRVLVPLAPARGRVVLPPLGRRLLRRLRP